MLANRPAAARITFRDIDGFAVQAGPEVSAEIQPALGEEGRQGPNRGAAICPAWGNRMQRRGQPGRQGVTEAGSSHLERVSCVCPRCGYSFFPRGRRLGVG